MLHLEPDWTYRAVDLDVESRAACKNDFLFSREANILRRTRDVILLPLVLVALAGGVSWERNSRPIPLASGRSPTLSSLGFS